MANDGCATAFTSVLLLLHTYTTSMAERIKTYRSFNIFHAFFLCSFIALIANRPQYMTSSKDTREFRIIVQTTRKIIASMIFVVFFMDDDGREENERNQHTLHILDDVV